MTNFLSNLFKATALGIILCASGFVRAAETPEMGEPWEFNARLFPKITNWQFEHMASDDYHLRNDIYYRLWATKLAKDALPKRMEKNNFQLDTNDTTLNKDLISLINKFNKLEGSKAITKVEVESKHAFQLNHTPDDSNSDSEKLQFFEFIKLKHAPITLDSVGRNEKDTNTRDRCTMLVTYEEYEPEVKDDGHDDKTDEKPKKRHLKTNYYFVDETRGGESEMHLYKGDGTWDRMEQK